MKLATLGLTLFGLVAALGAAVLVNTLNGRSGLASGRGDAGHIEILLAAKDLPVGSVVDAHSLTTESVPKKDAPKGYISNPVQVVGKILAAPMIKDQPFSSSYFAGEGTGFHVVSALKDGMRAVSVALADHAGLEGLLYPGSVVDVLVSFRAPAEDGGQTQPMTITLLYGVRVLAVEKQTIGSTSPEESPAIQTSRGGSRRQMVTLAVDPRQAEGLRLAQEFGTVSLTMRNPMDRTLPKADGVVLSELAEFKKLLRVKDVPPVLPGADPTLNMAGASAPGDARVTPPAAPANPNPDSAEAPLLPPYFTTTVINGPMDASEASSILRVTYEDRESMEVVAIEGVRTAGEGGMSRRGGSANQRAPRRAGGEMASGERRPDDSKASP